MHKLYELKEMLCSELEKYGSKELSAGSLEVIDKLAHAVKNIDKILESYDDGEYSNARGGRSYARGGNQGGRSNAMMGGSYNRGGSYAQRRDSRGRYSREAGYSMAGDEMAMELREIMADAPNEIRMDIQRIIDKVEQM